MDETGTVTADDVDDLNRAALDRSSFIARLGGTALVVIGAVGVVAWGWITVRQQQQASPIALGPFGANEEISLVDRVTLASSTYIELVFSGVGIALGLLVRAIADLGQVRAGGSITGLRPGQPVPYEELDLDTEA